MDDFPELTIITMTPPIFAATAVLAALTSVAAPALAQTPGVIKIGLIGPFSGASSDFGTPMRHGVELAVKEINDLGGYGGRKLELVTRDDKGTPDAARAASVELVKAGVVAAIGFCNTGNAMKSLEVFQNGRVPLIVPCATGTPITATYPAETSYIFRTSAKDSVQVPFVVNNAVSRGWTRIAVFADNTGYGEAGLKDFMAAMAAHRLKPVLVKRFDIGVQDLSAGVKEARDAGAQALFTLTVGPENALIGRAREALGWKVTQIGAWPLSFPFYIDGAKGAAEGSLMAQTFIAEPSNERRASFLTAYKRLHQVDRISVPVAAAQAYDATYLLAYAMFRVPSAQLDGAAIKHALETNDRAHYGVVTTYKSPFSKTDHDAITANMLYLGMVKNGLVTFAHPEDASRTLVVPRKLSEATAPALKVTSR